MESSSEIQPKSSPSSSRIDQSSNTADNCVKKTGRNTRKRRWCTDNKTDLQGSSAKQSGPIHTRLIRLKRTRQSDDEDELGCCSAKKLKPENATMLPIRREAEKVMMMRHTTSLKDKGQL